MPQRESQTLADVSSSLNSFVRFLDDYADKVSRHALTVLEAHRKPIAEVVACLRLASTDISRGASFAMIESARVKQGCDPEVKASDECDCIGCSLIRQLEAAKAAAGPKAPTNGHANPEAKVSELSYVKGEPVEFRFDAQLEWRTGRIEGPNLNTDGSYLIRDINGVVYGISRDNIRAVPIAEPVSHAASVDDL